MAENVAVHHEAIPDTHQDRYGRTVFGFWVYLMTDCMLFAVLFATYAVLHKNIWDGPSSHEIFDMNFVLVETFALLLSSYTSGLAGIAAKNHKKKQVLVWFALTFVFGAVFLGMELYEFRELVIEGYSWRRSGFLSSFFTLVATHGTHITFGLLWLLVLTGQIFSRGLTEATLRRLTCFRLFWHFLDVVWIFIFTLVYLMGVI